MGECYCDELNAGAGSGAVCFNCHDPIESERDTLRLQVKRLKSLVKRLQIKRNEAYKREKKALGRVDGMSRVVATMKAARDKARDRVAELETGCEEVRCSKCGILMQDIVVGPTRYDVCDSCGPVNDEVPG